MKNTLLALCALSALCAGAASAQSSTRTESTTTTTTSTSGPTYRSVLHYDTASDPNGSRNWYNGSMMEQNSSTSTVDSDVSNKNSLEETSTTRRNYRMNTNGTVESSTEESTRIKQNSTTIAPMVLPMNGPAVRPGSTDGEPNNSNPPRP